MEDATKSTWIVAALQQYESHLVRYAAWILGDTERAREVVQETFLRLCRENQSRVDGHLAQWLFTVCRNLSFDVRKKENRMKPLADAEALGAVFDRPFEHIERQETISQVSRVMETLPKNQKEVVILKFQHELSYKEISEITKLSVTNVGFLLHTAIKALRKELLAESAESAKSATRRTS
jgi:RNA polymerase sigma-70 factor (ECF subfamily)